MQVSPFWHYSNWTIMRKLLFLLLAAASCTNPPYRGKEVVGADEFVMDSYRIREGKFSILEMEGKAYPLLPIDTLQEYRDTISDGDILQIGIFHPSRNDLSEAVQRISGSIGFRVSEGSIILPDIGAVEVKGMPLDEARGKIQKCYDEEIQDLQVFISYKERVRKKVELAGLVQVPALPIDGKLRLFEVLATAKVPPEANLFKSYLVRDGALLPVDLFKLLKEGDMSQNIVMRGGDKIYIAEPSAATLMVLGEVGQERLVNVPNGSMTLRQAIAEAKGIAPTGDKAYIQIIRGSILQPKIYTLHWRHMVELPNDSMLLIPGDIVYVAATPITEWNRFVSQLLPTFIGLDLVTKGIKSVGVNIP